MHTDPASPKPAARHGLDGFTLIELLVVIALVLTLAALTLAVVNKARARADNVRAVLNMKEIGSALAAYMSEHDHLPTFRDLGVSAAISTADPYTQAYVLQPYLGINDPTSQVQYAKIFQPPGLKRDNMSGKKNWYEVTCYAMYSSEFFPATKAYFPKGAVIGEDGVEIGPFGRVSDTSTVIDGWRPAQFDAALRNYSQANNGRIATLAKVPAMLEINAKYACTQGSWPWTVPQKPLRGDHINVLYFDWRVESVTPQYFYTP